MSKEERSDNVRILVSTVFFWIIVPLILITVLG